MTKIVRIGFSLSDSRAVRLVISQSLLKCAISSLFLQNTSFLMTLFNIPETSNKLIPSIMCFI